MLKLKLFLSFLLLFIFCLNFNTYASVFDRSAAISYAEKYVYSYNPNYPSFSSDCANYVSQCLHAGGIPMSTKLNNEWYCMYIGGSQIWNYSHSWTVAEDLYNWLENSNIGSWIDVYDYDIYTASIPEPTDSNYKLWPADVIFYDWDSNGIINHSSIVVGSGTDRSRFRQNWNISKSTYI
ncbi:amidase domain-containing protein [Caldanaerobius polysaccharolyticus]|uniref:amidase domain-containing protein n=1 Tax=Caldanaerobius polysaccharolyticus TaxID=44256 RepID=UPI0006915DE0|nr:amidase domain-containing protein [Caldanaerobius polysaccharolyticus]